MPLFSIITPSLQRDSLVRTCQSLDEQRFPDFQHIVIIDCAERNEALIREIEDPRRLILQCPKPHRNGGNTCRHDAWEHATGEIVWHVDDDNFAASPVALEQIADAWYNTQDIDWMLFPIFRHGHLFYFDPPRPCYFDTGNAVVRRENARWPKH